MEDIENGRASTVFGTLLNAVASYTCDDGYILEGAEERTCQSNGKWSRNEPACNRESSMSLVADMNDDK